MNIELEKFINITLEIALMKTQIIEAFYPQSAFSEVSVEITDIDHQFASAVSFRDSVAGSHNFQYDEANFHYLLIEEFEL